MVKRVQAQVVHQDRSCTTRGTSRSNDRDAQQREDKSPWWTSSGMPWMSDTASRCRGWTDTPLRSGKHLDGEVVRERWTSAWVARRAYRSDETTGRGKWSALSSDHCRSTSPGALGLLAVHRLPWCSWEEVAIHLRQRIMIESERRGRRPRWVSANPGSGRRPRWGLCEPWIRSSPSFRISANPPTSVMKVNSLDESSS